jgi:hypothetical protein
VSASSTTNRLVSYDQGDVDQLKKNEPVVVWLNKTLAPTAAKH